MKSLDKRLATVASILKSEHLILTLESGERHYLARGAPVSLMFALMGERSAGRPLPSEQERLIPLFADSRPEPNEGEIMAAVRRSCRARLGLDDPNG